MTNRERAKLHAQCIRMMELEELSLLKGETVNGCPPNVSHRYRDGDAIREGSFRWFIFDLKRRGFLALHTPELLDGRGASDEQRHLFERRQECLREYIKKETVAIEQRYQDSVMRSLVSGA